MSEASRKLMANAKRDGQGRRSDVPKGDRLSPDEQAALNKIRREARSLGSDLTSGGKGGLPPSLVLKVMRRDKYCCKVCGELGDMEENGGIGVHHKYQHIQAPEEREKGERANREGRRNDPSQMTTICARCHDDVHEEDRQEHPGEPDADEVDR